MSFGDPILVPADLAGQGFRTLDPRAVELFDALGADVRLLDGNAYFSSVARGELRGADASTTTAIVHPAGGTVTADVAYAPMTTAIVANLAWFDRLGADQRTILERAARETSAFIADSAPTPAEAARAYCDAGGTVVLAGSERLATWRAAAAPMRERLEDDPATATVIAAIDSLARGSPPEPHPAVPCTAAPATRDPDPVEADAPGAFPEGTFRAEIPERAFLNAGIDRQTARGHSGIWTLTFRAGEYESTDPYAPVHDCPGSTYRVEGGRIVVTLGAHGTTCGGAAGQVLFSATWTYDGAALRFTNVRPGDPSLHEFMGVMFGSTPWVRID